MVAVGSSSVPPGRRTSSVSRWSATTYLRVFPVLVAVLAWAGTPRADEPLDALRSALPPWVSVPIERWPSSLWVREGEQSLHVSPTSSAPRRGTAAEGAFLPAFGAQFGNGCRGAWFQVGPAAWVCGDGVEPSVRALPYAAQAARHSEDGLPFRYYFAGAAGARGYHTLVDFDVVEPAFQYDKGFAVAILEERILQGERYGLTRRGLWVRLAEFSPARPSTFQGVALSALDRELALAWVVVDRAPLYRRAGTTFVLSGGSRVRFDRVGWLEEVPSASSNYVRIDNEFWIRSGDIRHPTRSTLPVDEGVLHGARWLDIELASQTLVAYEGDEPKFATLVSTGRGNEGKPLATPKGAHRIWVKLLGATMDNLENEGASNYYRIEDVPYVQFFSKGVGLHAAFWHQGFGHEHSHGCVNVAPRDAAFLFAFTGPHLPSGWSAVLPTGFEPGTLVRVR